MNQSTGDIPSGAHSQGFPPALCLVAAGLDTGFLGAVSVVLWFVAGSMLGGGFWFSRLNLAAAPFFGDLVFHSGPGWHTLCGAALLILFYSLLGVVYALLPASREGWLSLLTALGYAGLVHLCADAWLWKSLHPFAPPYFAPLAIAPAHLLFGLSLWRYPSRLRSLALSLGDALAIATLAPRPAPPAEPSAQTAAEAPEAAAPVAEGPSLEADPPQSEIEKSQRPIPMPPAAPPESSVGDGSPPPSSLE